MKLKKIMKNSKIDISELEYGAQLKNLFLGLKILNPKSEVTKFMNANYTQFCL